jgi:hypothetical protein
MSINKRYFLIKDTDDNVTEYVSSDDLVKYIQSGVVISNLKLDGVWTLTDTSYIQKALEEFKRRSLRLLVKASLMHKDTNFKHAEVDKIAEDLGLIPKGYRLAIDLNKCKVVFEFQGCIFDFSKDADISSKVTSIDVCDKKVLELSTLGYNAFNYMKLNLGTKASPNYVNLAECFNELRRFNADFDERYVKYIGITPSNRIFKVLTRYSIYSVKFCTLKELREKRRKIEKLGTTTWQLKDYIRDICSLPESSDCVAIEKVSYKEYMTYDLIKKKYKTLQDVYISEELR